LLFTLTEYLISVNTGTFTDMSKHRIIFGDSRYMPEIADETIHFMVTSPPYWCIRDYSHQGQIGYNQKYADYVSDLSLVLGETYRVLHPGCRAAVNVGDQYLRASEHGRYRVMPIPADIIAEAHKIGFDFMGNIIWKKISTTKTTGGGVWMGSVYHPRDGHITYEHEYIIILKKPGKAPKPTKEQKENSRLTREERSEWFRGIWEIHPERQNKHFAVFPLEIPYRLIKMYSFQGETVLDPFMGSGTTAKAAHMLDRNCSGYEINSDFKSFIEEKLCEDSDVSFEYRNL
jgi:modification methylase